MTNFVMYINEYITIKRKPYYLNIFYFFKYYITLLIIIIKILPISSTNAYQGIVDPINNQYSFNIIQYSIEEFTNSLINYQPYKSSELLIEPIINKYDKEINSELQTFIGRLNSLILTPKFGYSRLNDFLGTVNEELRGFSRNVENECISLIYNIKKKGIFQKYAFIDTIDETKEKLEKLNIDIQKDNNNIKNGIIGSATGAAISIVSYDSLGAATYLSSVMTFMYDYMIHSKITTKKQIFENQKPIIDSIQSNEIKITKSQRLEFENKIYVFSQLYCSMGYNLQIKLNNYSIQFIGDRVSYIAMVNLITTLEQNLDLEITRLISDQPISEKNTIMELDSLYQRLDILKQITNFLYNIISFSTKIQILKMTSCPTARTLNEFEIYLTDILNQLKNLLTKLHKKFPLKEELLEERRKQIQENTELQLKQLNINELIHNASSIERKRAIELINKDNFEWWIETKSMYQNSMDMGLNVIFFFKEYLKNYTRAFIDLASQGPLEIINSLLRFLNDFIYIFSNNFSGWILLLIGSCFIELSIGGLSKAINLAIKFGKIFIFIIINPIIFISNLKPSFFITKNSTS